jgi:hypothetical protein
MFFVDDGHVIGTLVTVTFGDRAGKTLFTLRQTGFDRREDRDTIKGSWPSILDAVGRVVAARASGGRP